MDVNGLTLTTTDNQWMPIPGYPWIINVNGLPTMDYPWNPIKKPINNEVLATFNVWHFWNELMALIG